MYKCLKDMGILSSKSKVIDIGGGMSPMQYILANHGCQVFNLDINFTDATFPIIHNRYYENCTPEFIKESDKNLHNIIRINGDALETLKGIPTDSIDAVIDLCALHIFLKDGTIMNEISRVLKPKGHMISIGDIANPHLGKTDEEFLYPVEMARRLSTHADLQLIEPYDYETWEKELLDHDNLLPRKNVDYNDLSLMNMKTNPSCISYHNVPILPIHIWTGIFVLQKNPVR
jgi:SAM-dependent methyltransferase